eukprot:1525707-Rhodomonas_salina.3
MLSLATNAVAMLEEDAGAAHALLQQARKVPNRPTHLQVMLSLLCGDFPGGECGTASPVLAPYDSLYPASLILVPRRVVLVPGEWLFSSAMP